MAKKHPMDSKEILLTIIDQMRYKVDMYYDSIVNWESYLSIEPEHETLSITYKPHNPLYFKPLKEELDV